MEKPSQTSNWLPHSSDVLECTSWKPSGTTTLNAFDSSTELGIGSSYVHNAKAKQLHVPELYSHSHAFGNVGGRICCMAAQLRTSDKEIDVAISTASHGASQLPGTVAEGDGQVQFWTVGANQKLACRFVMSHPGGRSDAMEWCPSTHTFTGGIAEGRNDAAALGLLLLVAAQSVRVFAVPQTPEELSPEFSYEGEDICCLKLRHKVEVPASRLSCESPTCAKWSPHAPCNELLVGTDLGTVAVIVMHEAHGSTGPSFSVCSLVRSGISSVRCLAWAPVQVQHGPVPSNNANLFCVCAGQSVINIYDTRQPQVVALDLSLGATGPDVSDVEWLEGDGCPLLVVGLMDGVLRRFSLAQSPASLGCNLTSSVDAITSLSYSNRLKLVAYATGGGEAGVLACISRLNPRYIEERGWDGAIRCIPRAPLFKIAYKIDSSSTETGSWSVAQGKDIPTVAPCEYWRARFDIDMPPKESVESIKKAAHPWACVTQTLLIDGPTNKTTTFISCSNSCLFMICKISLGSDIGEEDGKV